MFKSDLFFFNDKNTERGLKVAKGRKIYYLCNLKRLPECMIRVLEKQNEKT